ncbi:acyl-CoA desaturase [uncultured Psychroserpens sp.]|uniref:fatty acid desaturase family protein n=1 Tax=uncultured Psychroserpens sp. TaxID=255436 RepID=UPI00263A2857|nr:acyl-CoA desaturase [uncultured Psychroserpens sp.]
MLLLFFTPLTILASGIVASTSLLFVLYTISGFGMAGIGMSVMHDAIHGSYSKHKEVNTLLGYTFNLIGANATVWKIQHNVLHHTYTNINEFDDDLNSPFFLRFSPHAKHHWLNQFQHIYIWFFYAISTVFWVTIKDFVRLKRYKNIGFFNKKYEYEKIFLSIIAWKLLYYSYALVLPMLMVNQPWWLILLAFLSMHIITGLLVSIVFQIAHIMPENDFPVPDKSGNIEESWYSHQFATTSNFSPRNKFIFWFTGGLNYQVEHHLLPDVCHVHYKKISKIVSQTAQDYGFRYHVKKTLYQALVDHIQMLRLLGKKEKIT